MKMKKLVAMVLAMVTALSISTVAMALPRNNTTDYTYTNTQLSEADEAELLADYLTAMETRKVSLKDYLDRGLLTQSRYDICIERIDENIAYVLENGFSTNGYGNCVAGSTTGTGTGYGCGGGAGYGCR